MIQMTLAEAATILSTPAGLPSLSFQGISINTQTLQPGNLFVALPGSRVDGHDFLNQAAQKGAVAALVSRPVTDAAIPQLLVADPALALGKLSAAWRKTHHIPLVAITGSSGKTTLKNRLTAIAITACAGDQTAVLATEGTLNNHLGVPLTLARLNHHHRYGMIEMGMNHFGEIAYLTKLTEPQVALITNAGPAHLAGVGSIEGVAKAKAEIFLGLKKDGIAILNRDDQFFDYWRAQLVGQQFISFGLHPEADVSTCLQSPGTPLTIRTPKGSFELFLPLPGNHHLLNALAATAAAIGIGIDLSAIQAGLEHPLTTPGRLELHTLSDGIHLIDDSYNANPLSLKAAIETLAHVKGHRIFVLADMKELGEAGVALHQAAGKQIREAGIQQLFTYGQLSAESSQAFGQGAQHFDDQPQLIQTLKQQLKPPVTILVKGSRSMQMEKVVADLITTFTTKPTCSV